MFILQYFLNDSVSPVRHSASCTDRWCNKFTLKVDIASKEQFPLNNSQHLCRYGDEVILESSSGYDIYMHEIAIIARHESSLAGDQSLNLILFISLVIS